MLPKNRPPTHPGEMLLKEFIEPTGITQTELANHLKWPYARLNEIINCKRGVSPESALSLGQAWDTGPEFWLNLQRDWDLWNSRKKHHAIKPIKKKFRQKLSA
ncbi:MAG: HigA family addiction module antitoxin [Nitrospinota bacterium]